MARGMKTGGRKAGVPNKKTVIASMVEDALASPAGRELVAQAVQKLAQPPKGGKKAVDVLREMMMLSGLLVAQNAPTRDESGVVVPGNDEKLQAYLPIAVRAAAELAKFESPTFKAVAIADVPAAPGAPAGGDAKVVESIEKRSQQDAAAVYMRLVRGGKAA